jgi:small subunit ribosomal protein S8e
MVKATENLKKRKATGGKKIQSRGRRAYETDGYPFEPTVGERAWHWKRTRGGRLLVGLVSAAEANVFDPSSARIVRTKISRVKSSPASRDYERRGVITKGAVLETELGDARVTSRPSRDGVVNAVLMR